MAQQLIKSESKQIAEREEPESKIDRTCNKLKEYYKMKKVKYNAIFSTWCNDNGYYDDNAIEEVLNEFEESDPTEWMLAEWAMDGGEWTFPFNQYILSQDEKYKYLYKFMKAIWSHPDLIDFNVTTPQWLQPDFGSFHDITIYKIK